MYRGSYTEAPIYRCFFVQRLVYRGSYLERLLHTEAPIDKSSYIQRLLYKQRFLYRGSYLYRLLYTEAHVQRLLHTEAPICKVAHIQLLLFSQSLEFVSIQNPCETNRMQWNPEYFFIHFMNFQPRPCVPLATFCSSALGEEAGVSGPPEFV